MKKLILLSSALLIGALPGYAGWVYHPDVPSDQEVSYEDELDLTQTLGQIEDDQEYGSLSYEQEQLLPWGIDESNREEISAFVEEHAKEAYRDYEERFTLDSHEDLTAQRRLPSAERIPVRSNSLTSAPPRIVEAPRRRDEVAQSEKPLRNHEKLAPKRKVQKRAASSKKSGDVAKASPGKKAGMKKNIVRKERSSKAPEVAQKKKSLKQKKGTLAERVKRLRPTERIARNDENEE